MSCRQQEEKVKDCKEKKKRGTGRMMIKPMQEVGCILQVASKTFPTYILL